MSKTKIVCGVVCTLLCIFAIWLIMDASERNPRVFVGRETFDTLEAAQQFQFQLVEAAEEVDASILSIDMSMVSPLRITYSILMPTEGEFKFGERGISFNLSRSMGATFVAFILIALAITWSYQEGGQDGN